MSGSRVVQLIATLAVGALMPPLAADEVYLKNGDRVSGRVVAEDASQVVLEHEAIGSVTISKAFVERIVQEETASAARIVQEAPASPWTREMSLGYNLSRGNTEKEQLSGTLLANRKTDQDELTFKAEGFYAASSRRMDAQRYSGMARYASSFGSRLAWYKFYTLEVEHDRFEDVDWRAIPSAGIGYWFADQDDWKLMTEVGIGWERTSFRGATKNRSDLVLVPRAYAYKTVLGDATISQELILWPNLSETGEFRLRAETALTNPLAGGLALRVSFIDEFQSDPAAAAKKNDARLISSVVYAF